MQRPSRFQGSSVLEVVPLVLPYLSKECIQALLCVSISIRKAVLHDVSVTLRPTGSTALIIKLLRGVRDLTLRSQLPAPALDFLSELGSTSTAGLLRSLSLRFEELCDSPPAHVLSCLSPFSNLSNLSLTGLGWAPGSTPSGSSPKLTAPEPGPQLDCPSPSTSGADTAPPSPLTSPAAVLTLPLTCLDSMTLHRLKLQRGTTLAVPATVTRLRLHACATCLLTAADTARITHLILDDHTPEKSIQAWVNLLAAEPAQLTRLEHLDLGYLMMDCLTGSWKTPRIYGFEQLLRTCPGVTRVGVPAITPWLTGAKAQHTALGRGGPPHVHLWIKTATLGELGSLPYQLPWLQSISIKELLWMCCPEGIAGDRAGLEALLAFRQHRCPRAGAGRQTADGRRESHCDGCSPARQDQQQQQHTHPGQSEVGETQCNLPVHLFEVFALRHRVLQLEDVHALGPALRRVRPQVLRTQLATRQAGQALGEALGMEAAS